MLIKYKKHDTSSLYHLLYLTFTLIHINKPKRIFMLLLTKKNSKHFYFNIAHIDDKEKVKQYSIIIK